MKTVQEILDTKVGEKYQPGDPVLFPSAPKARMATFKRYTTFAGADRRIEIMLDGDVQVAYESYLVPDMRFWSR